jgi:hypothetical protein
MAASLDAKNRIPARLATLGVSLNFYGRALVSQAAKSRTCLAAASA